MSFLQPSQRKSANGSMTSDYSLPHSPAYEDISGRPRGTTQGSNAEPPPRLLVENYLRPAYSAQLPLSPEFVTEDPFDFANADPMAAHLLLETAMAESQRFRVLSPDELDRLKKEEMRLARNIEALRKKLNIESRADNTEKLLQRLGPNPSSSLASPRTPVSPKKSTGPFLRLRTSMSSMASNDTSATRSDTDSSKLQELHKELWKLEKKQSGLHSRKLEHTAGVLQTSYQRETSRGNNRIDEDSRPFSFASEDDTYGLGIQSSSYLLDGTLDMYGQDHQLRGRLREVNMKMRGLWSELGSPAERERPQPPNAAAASAEQLNYLENCLFSMSESHGKLLQLVYEGRRRRSNQQLQSQQVFEVLAELWDTVKTAEGQSLEFRSPGELSPASADGSSRNRMEENFSLDGFSNTVNAICARATTLERQQVELKNHIARERASRSSRDTENSQLAGRLRAASDQNAVAQDDIQSLRSQLLEATTLAAQAREDGRQEVEMAKQQSTLEHVDEITKERNARKSREHELTTRLAAKGQEVTLLRSALNEREKTITELEEAEFAARDELEENTAKVDAMASDLLAAEARADGFAKSGKDLSAQIERITAEKSGLEDEMRKVHENLTMRVRELITAEEKAKSNSDQVVRISAEKALLEKQIAQYQEESTVLKQSLADAEQRAAMHAGQSQDSSKTAKDLTSAKDALEDEIEHLRGQVVTLSAAIQDAEDRASSSESRLRDKTQQLSRTESERKEAERSHDMIKVSLHTLQAELEATAAERRSELDNLKVDHNRLKDTLQQEIDARVESENALQARTSDYVQLSQKHAELNAKMDLAKSQAKTTSTERSSARVQLDEALRDQQDSQARVVALQKELGDMITDYENLVKLEVDGEKERVALEGTVDILRRRVEDLERQLNEEKVRAMGRSRPILTNGAARGPQDGTNTESDGRGRGSESTSLAVMRNEFRKMMKDAKAEHHRALRAEQEERRRLEAIVRSFQRDHIRPQSIAASGISMDNASLLSASDVFAS